MPDSPMSPEWFDESHYYTGCPLTDAMIQAAESSLGYKLPDAYLDLLRMKNGGTPRKAYFPTDEPTGWADDHVQIEVIFGIGRTRGIDAATGSRYLIGEWQYPDVGVVIGFTPSGGHEAIMLDYSQCGRQGEPRVIYVDTETGDGEPQVLVLAPDFATFIRRFVDISAVEAGGE